MFIDGYLEFAEILSKYDVMQLRVRDVLTMIVGWVFQKSSIKQFTMSPEGSHAP